MRVSYAESMIDPTFYLPLARAAEEAGFHTFMVPDSICYPQHSSSKYPYNGTGDREFLEDKPFLEPFSLVPAMAAVTERIRFCTFVLKLPIRSPVLLAKQVSSVAVLSGNRFSLGAGVSPWPEDFEITDVDWSTRGKRMNEMITILRGLLAGGFYEFKGEIFDLPSLKICPVPSAPVPILIGGHADAALERAAKIGDGWMFAGGNPEELDRCLVKLAEFRKKHGRENAPFEIHGGTIDGFSLDGLRRLEDKGVTDVVVGFRNAYAVAQDTQPLEVKIGAMKKYADKILSKL